jgi:hypothetical protein
LAAGPFRRVRGRLDHTGRVVLSLPIGSVDLRVDLHDHGYRPLERTGVVVVADDGPGGELVLALQRGAELHLGVRGDADFTAEVRKGHVFFVLHDTQVDAVRGPFPPGSDQSNFEIDGLHVWLRDRWLLDQMPAFTGEDCSTLNGLTPGTYRLAAFPDDLVFEPATFAVGPGDTDVELRWRRR